MTSNNLNKECFHLLEEKFWKCFYRADKLYKTQGCSPSDGLDMYGYYKQATTGDNHKAKPSIANLGERLKWEAWNKKRGIPREEAMKRYIDKMMKTWNCSDC